MGRPSHLVSSTWGVSAAFSGECLAAVSLVEAGAGSVMREPRGRQGGVSVSAKGLSRAATRTVLEGDGVGCPSSGLRSGGRHPTDRGMRV
jgi:hypothetical protein